MLGEIYRDLEPQEYSLLMTKPSGEQVAILSEACNTRYRNKLKDLNELEFDVPYYIYDEIKHKQIVNPNFNLIKGDYLINFNNEEIFIVLEPNDDGGEINNKHIKCFSLEYNLRKRSLKNLKGVFQIYKLSTDSVDEQNGVLNYLEQETTWRVNYIDPDVKFSDDTHTTKVFRDFDIPLKSWYEFLYTDFAKAFDCIVRFDSVNKQIYIYSKDNIGENKGLYISEQNYLKSIGKEPRFDDVVTRLYVYGKDNLSINQVNPTGEFYIEDFSYYIENEYMSDGLVTALNNYNTIIETKKTTFKNYLSQLTTQYEVLAQKEADLFALETEKKMLWDSIKNLRESGQDYSAKSDEYDAKLDAIIAKQAEIDNVFDQIDNINTQITTLQSTLKKENNFTAEQLDELDYYIKDNQYSNQFIFDPETLYTVGLKQLNKLKEPPINFNIDVVDILKIIECQHDWDKVVIGDKVNINYPKFNIDVEIQLISITHEYDNNKLTLEFSNGLDEINIEKDLAQMIQKANESQVIVDISRPDWNNGGSAADRIDDLWDDYDDLWDDLGKQIITTDRNVNSSLEVLPDSIVATVKQDLTDPLTNRISTAESNITVNANAISSRVSYTDYTGAVIASKINQTYKSIDMSAIDINLSGMVTFSDLTDSSTTISGDCITTGTLNMDRLGGNSIRFDGGGELEYSSGGVRMSYGSYYAIIASGGFSVYYGGTEIFEVDNSVCRYKGTSLI